MALTTGVLSIAIMGIPRTAGAVPVPWRNCGTVADLIVVSGADSSKWPPVAGQSITLDVHFVLRQHIWGGYEVMDLSTSPPGLPTWPEEASFGPRDAGPYNQLVTLVVPPEAGGQIFNVTFRAYGSRQAQLLCVQATVPVKAGSSTASNPSTRPPEFSDSPMPRWFLWRLFQDFLPTSDHHENAGR